MFFSISATTYLKTNLLTYRALKRRNCVSIYMQLSFPTSPWPMSVTLKHRNNKRYALLVSSTFTQRNKTCHSTIENVY